MIKQKDNRIINRFIVIEELKWGILCFDELFENHAVIKIENGNNECIDILINKGWSMLKSDDEIILKAPRIVLCDILDENKNIEGINITDAYELHKAFMKVGVRKLLNLVLDKLSIYLDYVVVTGDNKTDMSITISCCSKQIHNIAMIICRKILEIKDDIKIENELYLPQKYYPKNKNLKCNLYSDISKNTHIYINQLIVLHQKQSICHIEGINFYYTGIWNQLKSYDCLVFVLNSGFKYLAGFVEETGCIDKIVLFEYHTSLPDKGERCINLDVLRRAKRVAIIDNTNTGKTMKYTNKKIAEYVNNNCLIHKISVFPKRLDNINLFDLVLYGDKFYKPIEISFN